jgi:hypothetical protein
MIFHPIPLERILFVQQPGVPRLGREQDKLPDKTNCRIEPDGVD